ncbi:hypothetical protein OHD62_03720 [Mesorhizobium sp. YC-39]|uniref:hypothetical protein n=1 Tax=unclassified Mesorhizobium TaxID=325217 RepID=UPI0021E7FB06|nr:MULTISPECIES: hypothetical protein [unclassified Mesorhizobium]MCV3206129.1 hypothetical protein [Mesorhizobium sp. YC-2]MCV3227471.1 hypothetical protein [Mesorhizobium sp. YC-39]
MMRVARSVLALLFAVAVLYGMQHTRPLYSDITSPIVASGGMNRRVEASAFALSLDRVRVARVLNVETFGKSKTYTSSGVWLVVEGEAEAKFETLGLTSGEWLSGSGVRYVLTDRVPATIEMMPGDVYQPGLPRHVLLMFEVPEDAVAGGTVVVARTKLLPLDDEIRIATNVSGRDIEPELTIRRNHKGPSWTVLPQR